MSGEPMAPVEEPVPPPGALLTNVPPPPRPAPTPTPPAAEPEPAVEIPSWTRRLILGALTTIGLIFLLVIVPTQLLA
ncbi:MAG TPA: hypothetical protein VIZ68_05825, partial [Thermoplasmata archaeon]